MAARFSILLIENGRYPSTSGFPSSFLIPGWFFFFFWFVFLVGAVLILQISTMMELVCYFHRSYLHCDLFLFGVANCFRDLASYRFYGAHLFPPPLDFSLPRYWISQNDPSFLSLMMTPFVPFFPTLRILHILGVG